MEREGEVGRTRWLAQSAAKLSLGDFDVRAIPERWSVGKGTPDIRGRREETKKLAGNNRRSDRRTIGGCCWPCGPALIAADAAGSGYIRVGQAVEAEVWQQFVKREPWTGDAIREKIIEKRIADLKEQFRKRNKTFEWNKFRSRAIHCRSERC